MREREKSLNTLNAKDKGAGGITHCKGDKTMTVKNNCIKICEMLRRRGFEASGATSIIPEDALINVVKDRQWSPLTQARYIRADGYLVQYEYLKPIEGGYQLTGEDLND